MPNCIAVPAIGRHFKTYIKDSLDICDLGVFFDESFKALYSNKIKIRRGNETKAVPRIGQVETDDVSF